MSSGWLWEGVDVENKSTIAGIIIIAIYAGAVYTLVRPGSQGPQLVTAVTGGVTNILQSSMGKGQNWH